MSEGASQNRGNLNLMEEISNPSFQEQIDLLFQRLKKIEKRLEELEEASRYVSRAKELRREYSPSPQEEISPNHNYLKRTIDDAKRRYEQEYRV